ncbi:MAG: hypothetical protein NTY47_03155 [Candidatus Omnitrophica bacterium]|nr:hypothetical protein [Candidatus Omnitrophota bacterium]
MKKSFIVLITGIVILSAASVVLAQDSPWGSALKSVGQAVAQKLTPQAQQTVDKAKSLGAPAQQENFIIAKAKEYLAAGNYQTALDLANYVKTMLDSKSIDASKIIADAQAGLTKMMQQKAAAVQ